MRDEILIYFSFLLITIKYNNTHISPRPTPDRTPYFILTAQREILVRLVRVRGSMSGSGTSCDANFALARLRSGRLERALLLQDGEQSLR